MSQSTEEAIVSAKGAVVDGGPPLFESAADTEATARAIRAAAPVAADVEAIGALDAKLRSALFGLLSSLADNKFVLGRRYAEWCTGAPMLESAVAAAAMAQDELGHARSFYPLLRGFPESTDATTAEGVGWQSRSTHAMACLDKSFSSWEEWIAANFVVDTALTTMLEAASDSPYEPLRQRARKIVHEEQAHWHHAHGWVLRLAGADESRSAFLENVAALWDDAFTWFGQVDDPSMLQLVSGTILSSGPDQLRTRLRERLTGALAEVANPVELADRTLPWERWNAQARRLLT